MVKLHLKKSLVDEWNKEMVEQWEKHMQEVEEMNQQESKFVIKWNDEGEYFFPFPKKKKEGYNKKEVKRLFGKWKKKYPALFV